MVPLQLVFGEWCSGTTHVEAVVWYGGTIHVWARGIQWMGMEHYSIGYAERCGRAARVHTQWVVQPSHPSLLGVAESYQSLRSEKQCRRLRNPPPPMLVEWRSRTTHGATRWVGRCYYPYTRSTFYGSNADGEQSDNTTHIGSDCVRSRSVVW